MNIQEITKILTDAGIEENEAKIEVRMLLEHFCNYTEKDRLMGIEPDSVKLEIVKKKAEFRAETRIPIQYIIGEAYFMGEYFKVTPDVLIPRDETEILVRKAIEIIERDNNSWLTPHPNLAPSGSLLKEREKTEAPRPALAPSGSLLKEREPFATLDIGTGSGCIACTIAKQTGTYVLGVDISSDALRVALDNVTKLGINNRAVFRKSDLFSKIREEEKFDMIISNPPYIPADYKFEPEVLHEPRLALIAEENGLEFYRKIVEEAPKFLKPKGWVLFELGIGEAEAVKGFMQKNFKDICVEKDLAGIERIIYGQLK